MDRYTSVFSGVPITPYVNNINKFINQLIFDDVCPKPIEACRESCLFAARAQVGNEYVRFVRLR
jgi:hypothetical protein